jgi:hypothetical protein
MNNTRFHFFVSQSPLCASTGYRQISRLYINSYKVVIKPVNFTVTVNSTTGEVCLTTHPAHQSIVYDIEIFDVSGYLAYTREKVNVTCTQQASILEQNACAPFKVQVTGVMLQQQASSLSTKYDLGLYNYTPLLCYALSRV